MSKADDSSSLTALLLEELKSDDVEALVNNVRRLTLIASTIGAEKTRSELLPFLADPIYHEDEVLQVLAEQLGCLVPHIGGQKYAPLLLPPLEALANADEPVVRDNAVQSLRSVAESHLPQDIEKHFVPVVRRLAAGEWFTSRISACHLVPACYQRSSMAVKSELLSMFRSFCNDDVPLVRRAAASRLGEFAARLPDAEAVRVEMLPLLARLIEDEHDSVRSTAVECSLHCVITLLRPSEVDKHALPLFHTAVDDKSWRVRRALAEKFPEVAKCFSLTTFKSDLVGSYLTFLRDQEAEVRAMAISKMKDVCLIVPPDSRENFVVKQIIPCIKDLIEDSNTNVKTALASLTTSLCALIGKFNVCEHLVPMLILQLKDPMHDVRLTVLSKLESICEVIGIRQLSQTLLPVVVELAEDANWRVREAVAEYMAVLAHQLNKDVFDEKFTPLTLGFLKDRVNAVREVTIISLRKLVDKFGTAWLQQTVAPKIINVTRERNYLFRVTALQCISALADCFGRDYVNKYVLSAVCALVTDPVPNVRFNIAKCLAKLGPQLDSSTVPQLKAVLDKLKNDQDLDVQYYTVEACDTPSLKALFSKASSGRK